MNRKPKVIVVGSINCDLSFFMQGFPARNETILARHSLLTTGGKGLNQAVTAARAGADTHIIGCVGEDSFGQTAKTYARQQDVDISAVNSVADAPTGRAGIFVTEAGENMIAVSPGANAKLTPDDIIANADLIKTADIVMAQLEVPAEVVCTAFEIAGKAGVKTLLNPAPATPEAKNLIKLADIISPNETETEIITGIFPHDTDTARAAALCLCHLGARHVVITMGARGYYVFTNGSGTLFAAFVVKAIDPTGAGDVFNGVLARALATGHSLEDAANIASAAGAICVTRQGAQGAAPNWREIQHFLDQIARL